MPDLDAVSQVVTYALDRCSVGTQRLLWVELERLPFYSHREAAGYSPDPWVNYGRLYAAELDVPVGTVCLVVLAGADDELIDARLAWAR
jgi:hypothetical protein